MIAIHLTATQKKAINCDISLTSLIPHQVKASNKQLTITGHAMGKPENSTHFCSILSIKNQDGTITASDSILHLQGVSEAVIYLVNETSYNGFDKHPVKEGAPYIEKVNDNAWHLVNYTYPELKQRHITDYQNIFNRAKFALKGARRAKPLPGNALFPIWKISSYQLFENSRHSCQSPGTLGSGTKISLAWKLHHQHQPGRKLLASRGNQHV